MNSANNCKPRVYGKFNEETKLQFLHFLSETGNLEASAAASGIASRTVRNHMQNSDSFREEVEQARAKAMNSIEREIVRRGLHGIERPVFYQGERVGTQKEYSDKLLLALAKANSPGRYAERQHVVQEIHNTDNENAKNKLLKLLQSEEVMEGEFTEISDSRGEE